MGLNPSWIWRTQNKLNWIEYLQGTNCIFKRYLLKFSTSMVKKNSTSIIQCIICMLSTQLWKIQTSCRIHTEGWTLFIKWNWQKSKSEDRVACQAHVMYEYELKIYFCALLLPFPVRPTEYCGCWMMDWRDPVSSVELHPRHAVHWLTFHLQAQKCTTITDRRLL